MITLVGKPLKFDTPEKLKEVLQEYFNTTKEEEWTVTGLSLRVGSKQLLNDYEKRDGYSHIVKEAKLIVENGYERDLKKYGRTGTIFALKNFEWKDESKVTQDTTLHINTINYANNNSSQFLPETISVTDTVSNGQGNKENILPLAQKSGEGQNDDKHNSEGSN